MNEVEITVAYSIYKRETVTQLRRQHTMLGANFENNLILDPPPLPSAGRIAGTIESAVNRLLAGTSWIHVLGESTLHVAAINRHYVDCTSSRTHPVDLSILTILALFA